MQGGDSLKVWDDEFLEYEQKMTELASLLENKLLQYKYILQTACNDGITSGHAHDNLQAFIQALSVMEGQLMLLSTEMGLNVNEFHNTVDELDEDLYY